jgi:hypothetical protein
MTPNTKGIIAVGVTLALAGLGYYFFVYRKKNASGDSEICADMIIDGFVYNPDKSQGYAKKSGEWAGCNIKEYKEDNDYWSAVNSKGSPILLKKSEVKTRKQKS